MKPGYKTTEFWISLFAVLVGQTLASGAVVPGSKAASVIGFIASALTAMGYTVCRTIAKSQGADAAGAEPPAVQK